MKLSIVDLGTVAPGTSETDAHADTLATARFADDRGFHRIWFGEHHQAPAHASHNPELLIAAAGSLTAEIRVGSGAMMLNYYSPYKVAETFQQLEAMFPGRVDLGIGRTSNGPIIDAALLPGSPGSPAGNDYQQRISETLAWVHEQFPEDHPFANHPLTPSVTSRPQAWLLGASPHGASLAAHLGIGYTFAAFINPGLAPSALQAYRQQFRAGPYGAERPHPILAVNVCVGADADDARRLIASGQVYLQEYGRIGPHITVRAGDDALSRLSRAERDEPMEIIHGRWPRFVAGDADTVRATLEQMLEESGAEELIIQTLIADPVDRRASLGRLADMFAVEPRSSRHSAAIV